MTAMCRREMLLTEHGGKGPLPPACGSPGSPRRYAARAGRPAVPPDDRLPDARRVLAGSWVGEQMDSSTPENPFSAHLLVQSRVFEVVAGSNALAGPVHELARRFDVEPDDFVSCLDGLVRAGWVTVKTERETLLRIQLAT